MFKLKYKNCKLIGPGFSVYFIRPFTKDAVKREGFFYIPFNGFRFYVTERINITSNGRVYKLYSGLYMTGEVDHETGTFSLYEFAEPTNHGE